MDRLTLHLPVTGFNHELFSTLISPNSKTHDPSICDFHAIGEHIFKQNEIWINRDLIKSVCDIFAKYEGWDAVLLKRILYVIDGVKKG